LGQSEPRLQAHGPDIKPVSAEQMEISRLRGELARVKMEQRDILGKATACFAKGAIGSTPASNATGRYGRFLCSAACSESAWLASMSISPTAPVTVPAGT